MYMYISISRNMLVHGKVHSCMHVSVSIHCFCKHKPHSSCSWMKPKGRQAGEMEELRRNIAELKGRNGDLISTIDDLNRKNADLENRNGDLKRLLEQTRDDRIKQALYENQVGGVTKNYVQRPV